MCPIPRQAASGPGYRCTFSPGHFSSFTASNGASSTLIASVQPFVSAACSQASSRQAGKGPRGGHTADESARCLLEPNERR